jgi:hypothetical protein
MTISSILFGIGLALLAGVYVARPFRERSSRPAAAQSPGERQRLRAQKAAIYAAIREIDADVQVGKLEPDDHRVLRRRYLAEGVAVLKALDAQPAGDQIDAAIEADVARLAGGEPLESPSGAFCPACGAPADAGDRFCGKCGASLRG